MPRLALVSNVGGCGRTSLVAHLARAFVEQGRRVLALECDPANLLGLHLGLAQAPEVGWASAHLAGQDWDAAAWQNSEAIAFLPFGEVACDQLAALESMLRAAPRWLAERLEAQPGLGDALVLFDTPPWPAALACQAVAAADFVLVVLEAEGRAWVQWPVLQESLAARACPYAVLVNRLDSGLPLERDCLTVLQHQLGERFVPYPVHRDEAVRLAFAQCVSLWDAYPHSQARRDIAGVATWLAAQAALAGGVP